MIILYISEVIAALVAIGIQVFISLLFAKSAESKGHPKWQYFWLSFFFGIIVHIIIAALPDRVLNEQIRILKKQVADQ